MYRFIVRPFLFLFDPEHIHKLIIGLLKIVFQIPLTGHFVRNNCFIKDPGLKRTVWGLEFKNPVGLAAGFDKNAECFNELSNFGFAFIEIGTVTPKGQTGNPKPRIFRLKKDKGLINRMGFNNTGVDEIIKKLQRKRSNVIIGGNIGKNTLTPNETAVNDYIYTFNKIYEYVDYLVVNVSCPNISDLYELQVSDSLRNILNSLRLERLKKNIRKPILLKISPDLSFEQIDEVIEIMKSADVDGFVATNTTTQRYNLTLKDEFIKGMGNGGMSGSPLKDRSTEIIQYIAQKTNGKIPIIGVGGIISAKDAEEKLKAGATLVQVYTGFIYEGPLIAKHINKSLIYDS